MSIGSDQANSHSIQARPGPAAAGSNPSATPTSSPDIVPRTTTPPLLPAKPQPSSQTIPQQQQIQQQQHQQAQASQNASSNTNNNVTTAPKAAPSAPPATAQPPPRPPPPASAVSLHAAAANKQQNAAQAGDAKSAAPIASKPSAPAASPSQAQANASATPTGKVGENAAAPPKKAAKLKTTKTPGTAKPKQKRRANQSAANDELVYRPGPSTAGGTIGAAPDSNLPAMLTAAGGGRKALSELVLPFQLPFAEIRPEMPMLDNASVQAAMAMGVSETSSLDTGSDSDDYSVLSDDSDLDSEAEESRREARRRKREPATIEESLVLLQSLRQSRLSHLSSLLTPFSQRVRSGMIYPNVLPLSLLHGLNPRDPHILIQLGRADIHVGPHVFLKTKFWEVRPDYEIPPVLDSMGGMRAPGSFGGPSVYLRMTMPQSMPQQVPLPQPQPPKLPLPRAAPTLPQPSVPLAPPPTTSNKSPGARPATTVTAAGNASTGTTPAASSLAASRPTGATTLTALPTPTLPATPIQSGLAARPVVTPKPAATPASSIAASTASTPAVGATPAPASTLLVKPATAGAAAPPAAASTLPPTTAAKPATPAGASASGSGASTPASATVDGKPAAVAPAASPAPVTLAPKPIAVPVSLPRPPSINQNHSSSSANAASSSSTGAAPAPPKATLPANASAAKPVTANANARMSPSAASTTALNASTPSIAAPAPNTANASAPSQAPAAAAAAKPAAPANANANATASQAPTRPAAVPPPPAIDAVLVSRVNATAALNPELQELLHIAASGKANPNQLKALGVWIQAITAQLRQDEARNAAAANNVAGASGSRAGNAASTTAEGKKSKKTKVDEAAKASKKQAKIEEREAKKKAKAEAKAKAQADKQLAQKRQKEKQHMLQQQQLHSHQHDPHQPPVSNKLRHPPPGWPTDGPPKPPVIIVEFRENPSMRFILPLWKCLVERTEGIERPSLPKVKKERRSFFDNDSDDDESQRIEPELKLSFFAPSLGSDAADGSGLRELEEELKRKAAEEAKLKGAGANSNTSANGASSSTASPEAATQTATGDKTTTEDAGSSHGKKKKGGANAGSKKGSKAIKQEEPDAGMSSDLSQSKKHEVYPLTWSIKGGVTESLWEAFGRVPGTMTCQPVKREPEIELEPDVAEFLVPEIRYHLLDLPMEEIKIQKETTDMFVDLYSQMPDRRFILPRVAPALLPQGLEDHLQDRFAVRPQCVQGRPMVKRKAGTREDDVSFSYEGIGLTVIGPNGVKTEPGATPPKPPKRKRHVATHNPDGSIKSCGACGKIKTPMWRRGPKGPSQLCNACGARWKAGRLVVPDVAPPPIIEAEEDKSKEDEAHKEDEAQASMHGSNALVIPQSSSADDGSYTVMASSGLVGSAPFGDPFSLSSEGKGGMDFGSSHLSRGSSSPSPFIRSPVPEDDAMPASVDPSMLSGSNRVVSHRR
ncbi:uncharacterized protein SPSC_01970 [Sporisorium scitamineum]|uniref:GATA-type domain-containing protein n=1 Tax=Sporisorium scitamineum TaxID=49012 RepID=A0A0F7SBW9_9BASI|nr:uncharacterized protein SPSC_01970 [Sporisorium scitamineum]CDW98273.1 hypothetical protein [Sporisorium scitamineum]